MLLTVKLVPATFAVTLNTPTFVKLLLVSCRNITLLAVTEVLEIVTVPPESVPVPILQFEPVLTLKPAPAVMTAACPANPAADALLMTMFVPATGALNTAP